MGEMADYYLDGAGFSMWGADEVDGYEGHESVITELMRLPDADLRRLSATAKDTKTVGIRKWPKPLSEKQRYCLAFYIRDHTNYEP